MFCDYNLENSCTNLENVIRPAPHDLAVQIDTNRIGLAVSLLVLILSIVIVWSTFRNRFVEHKVIFESEVTQIEKHEEIKSIIEKSPQINVEKEESTEPDFHVILKKFTTTGISCIFVYHYSCIYF